MKKLHPEGDIRVYDNDILDHSWILHTTDIDNLPEPFIICDCDSSSFKVAWWDYPYTGGYCKIVCNHCQKETILIDDYS